MSKYYLFLSTLLSFLSVANPSSAQQRNLVDSINLFSKPLSGTFGVAFQNLSTEETFLINADKHFPMQSVMKFPLAVAVLHQIDQGKLRLTDKVHLSAADLSIPFVSPIRDKYPNGNVEITIDELLRFTVSQSDNNGCDKLFQLLGGPTVVNRYLHSLGINNINIVATEKEMGQGWAVQYHNWCTPKAMLKLLELFEKGNILSEVSQHYLYTLLLETVNAPKRMKGLLPDGAKVAHKPGTFSVNGDGIVAATNDVGIVQLSGGKRFAVVSFVSDSKADLAIREGFIAQVTKLFWNYFTKKI